MSLSAPASRRTTLALLAFVAVVATAWAWGLDNCGMLGPDEPRYASIGREMAASGNWITPYLWGDAWFEKPALLYWLVALGYKLGLPGAVAPRLPLILVSAAFLVLQFFSLRRLFGERPAWIATLILPATAGWAAYSQIAVTDVPLAVTFCSTVWLGLCWWDSSDRRLLYAAGACFGLALLAKGLVPGVLILPLLFAARRRWRDLLVAAATATLVAAPWYAAMLARHGRLFFDDFIIKHHFSRFSSTALQHVQPFWFYLPVLLAGLFPFTAILGEGCRRWWTEPRQRVLFATFLFGLLFFSASTNKLPGYTLPLVPLLVALLALGLSEVDDARWGLALSAWLLGLCPVIAAILPAALLHGIRRASFGEIPWNYLLAALLPATLVWWLERSGRRLAAVALVSLASLGSLLYVKLNTAPLLDELVSARGLYQRIANRQEQVCVDTLHRSLRYGLNFYTVDPLPDCEDSVRPVAIRQRPGGLPRVEPR